MKNPNYDLQFLEERKEIVNRLRSGPEVLPPWEFEADIEKWKELLGRDDRFDAQFFFWQTWLPSLSPSELRDYQERHPEPENFRGVYEQAFKLGRRGFSRAFPPEVWGNDYWDALLADYEKAYGTPEKPDILIQDGPEALGWLRANGHEAALASNRFSSTADALSFVEQLYAAGAHRVFVPGDTIVDDAEERELGGAYSDSLVIELSSPQVPDALLSLYCQEATLEGYDLRHEPPPVIEGRYLILWWD